MNHQKTINMGHGLSKRLLSCVSVLLTAVLVLGLFPGSATATAFAQDSSAPASGTQTPVSSALISAGAQKVRDSEHKVVKHLKDIKEKSNIDLMEKPSQLPLSDRFLELQHQMDSGVDFFVRHLSKENWNNLEAVAPGISFNSLLNAIDGMSLDEIKLYIRQNFGKVPGLTEYLSDIENLQEELREYERIRNDYYYLGEQQLDYLTAQNLASRTLAEEPLDEETASLSQAEIAARGLEAIRATGWADALVLPQEDSYLARWKTGYARKAFQAPCLRVERISKLRTGRLIMPYLYEGVKATIVAEENDMSCIIYRGSDNELYAGWIQSIRLLDEFPGAVHTIGTAPSGQHSVRDDITVSWSKCSWLTSQQNYSRLSEPVKNCLGFTLEYQIISENTPNWNSILGPRTVYVKTTDEEWVEVGAFPYPELGATKVTVYLPKPMDINAIGTIAQCTQPNIFWFRQTATDFLVG